MHDLTIIFTIFEQVCDSLDISKACSFAWNVQNLHILFYFHTNANTKIDKFVVKNTSNFNRVFDNEGVRFTKISRRHKR